MALLSKPYKGAVQLLSAYLGQLYMHPLRTRSLTAATIAALGNFVAQNLSGASQININTLAAFSLFGLLFGGSVPHYFFVILERIVNENSKSAPYVKFLIERLFFMPIYSFFSLYTLARFELKSHSEAISSVMRFYPAIYEANIKYLSLFQFLNLYFVPPVLRVLVSNLIGFFWVIYIARKRAPATRKSRGTSNKAQK